MRVEVKHIHPKTGLFTIWFTAENSAEEKELEKLHQANFSSGYGHDKEGKPQLILKGKVNHDGE